jgi:glycosyltransferase involved in cell wall biosynthesis
MAERPLHVLIAGLNWPPEPFIAQLIQGLLERGLMITVATPIQPGREWRQQPGFNWLFTPLWEGWPGRRLIRLAALLSRAALLAPGDVRRFAAKSLLFNWYHFLPFAGQRWDVIYFPWNSAAVFYLPLFDLGCPVVISCRGSQINVAPHDPQRTDFVEGLKVTLARAAAVHCVSTAIKREAAKYGLEPQKAHVIYPAVNPDFFQPASQPKPVTSSPFRVIMIGALRWVKGYEWALLAVKQLADEHLSVHLDIIGDGHERQRLLYTVDDLGLQDVVQLHGHLTAAQIRDKLQMADAFLLTSLSEGISNAVLEAMACGLPVVTTDCGGMREAVTDGVEGLVAPVAAPEALAQALYTLFQSPDLRRQMGQAGRRRIEKEFALARQIQQFEALFQEAKQHRQIHHDSL